MQVLQREFPLSQKEEINTVCVTKFIVIIVICRSLNSLAKAIDIKMVICFTPQKATSKRLQVTKKG